MSALASVEHEDYGYMGGNFGVSLADAIMLSMTGCMQSQMDRSMDAFKNANYNKIVI